MEIVLKLGKQGMSEIRWERGIRVCLLLALSCILYCCVGMYSADYRAKTKDTMVHGRKIKQNGSMCGGYAEHMCINAGKTSMLYAREQENVAAYGLAVQREHTGIADRTTIIENSPFIENEREIKNSILLIEEETDRDVPVIEETDRDIPLIEEETDRDIPFIEEEAEDDMSSVKTEDESSEENDEIREIDGFFVDDQGYIVGVTETISFMDGILAITSDPACAGIKENAFSGVEADVFEIYIPANICEIEPGVFDVFLNLMYIEVSEESLYYYSMDGILYSESGEEIAYPAGR